MGRNDPLTAIRAIAALLVFLSHSANAGLAPIVFGFGLGQIGVMLFFALSGFLMTALYADRAFTTPELRAFGAARIGRVVPLFLLVVVASVLLTTLTDGSFYYRIDEWPVVARAVLFLQAPYELWSIPIEVHYYVAFVAIWAVLARIGIGWASTAIHLTLIALCLGSLPVLRKIGVNDGVLPYYATLFLIGGLVGTLYERHWLSRWFLGRSGTFLGFLALALLVINLPQLRMELGLSWGGFLSRTWLDPLNIASVTLLLLAAAYRTRPLLAIAVRPLLFVGDVSYGFYLFHRPIVEWVANDEGLSSLQSPLGLLLAFALTLALAALSFHYFEKRVADWVRRAGGSSRRLRSVAR